MVWFYYLMLWEIVFLKVQTLLIFTQSHLTEASEVTLKCGGNTLAAKKYFYCITLNLFHQIVGQVLPLSLLLPHLCLSNNSTLKLGTVHFLTEFKMPAKSHTIFSVLMYIETPYHFGHPPQNWYD